MFRNHGFRTDSDMRKLLYLATLLFTILAVAYVASADDSSAEQVDGKTYYFQQLNDAERIIVNRIADFDFTVSEREPGSGIYDMTYVADFEDLFEGYTQSEYSSAMSNVGSNVLSTVLWEYPEYFWINNTGGIYTAPEYTYDGEGKILESWCTVTFRDIYTEYGDTTEELEDSMNQVIAAVNAVVGIDTTTELSTITSIHNYICSILTYDKDTPDGMGCRNIYTAFLGSHEVVCEGYSKAFKILCDRFDVPCVIIVGTGVVSPTKSDGHMWCHVQMENERWYLVDCTWDDQDQGIMTEYLLAGSTTEGFNGYTVGEDHIVRESEYETLDYPEISLMAFADDNYTVTFLNYDGSEIVTQTGIGYGDALVLPADPTYTDPAIGTFTFTGWSPEAPEYVTKDLTFTAQYDIDYVIYTYTYHPDNGSIDIVQNYTYGEKVTVPAKPEKADAGGYSFYFNRWDPIVPSTVTSDMEFTALYNRSVTVTGNTGFELTSAVKTELANVDSFTVNLTTNSGSPLAKITFTKAMIAGLNTGQTLTVTEIKPSDLEPAVQGELENSKIFRIDFGSNNADLGGNAIVALYYEKSTFENLTGINLYYVNGTTLEQISYNTSGDYIVFETNHFSDYAVKGALELDGLMWFLPIIGILLIVVAGFYLSYRFG